ncbi:MAG TPA: ATP synthase F1 subunit delta [Flavipsychrobacter sp.]|jgi:F-type H+-transporting ATPase subunit delta|nr:ATP synthase F1 subunit delta [Flavipsychrobacter sp.]
MQNPRLASRYAKSLLDLANEQNSLETTLADITLLDTISRGNRDFENMLRSPIVNADKKLQILAAVFGTRISALTNAFIKLLVTKGREANLPEIATAFIRQYKELKNIKTIKLTTATPVNDSVKTTILNKVKASLKGSEVEINEKIDPSIIGGFVLEMDDKLFDASIKRDLNDVKNQFLKNIYVPDIR